MLRVGADLKNVLGSRVRLADPNQDMYGTMIHAGYSLKEGLAGTFDRARFDANPAASATASPGFDHEGIAGLVIGAPPQL